VPRRARRRDEGEALSDTVFLVNPASANGSTGKRWPELERRAAALGLEGRAIFSTRAGELGDLATQAVRDGARLLVVVGGDGTAHEVVDGLMKAGLGGEAELAFLPRGTGKDFVRSMRIPKAFDKAVHVALGGRARSIDVGKATYAAADGSTGEAYFANFAGAGISGAIAARANRTTKAFGGKLSFLYATVLTFLRWKPARMSLTIDGEVRDVVLLEALAMNGDNTAGGMLMAPEAQPDDGHFDVVLIGDFSKLEFVLTFPKIYKGKHVSHRKIDVIRAKELRVEANRELPIVLDGEAPGSTPVRFEVVPGALRVRVPA
jgi:YegS/Rv2252/BmrU family lipid kinase